MALIDFKQYLYKIQNQYLEMKADLTDFEAALKAGHITEDQLESVKQDIADIERNYQRLLYVAFLLELPRRKSKKEKYINSNKQLKTYFNNTASDLDSVITENTSLLTHLRSELKKLKNN